jgi:hypothetical protein
MNRCMIHGKELRWHNANLFTDHLFLAYLKVMPRLKRLCSLFCSICCECELGRGVDADLHAGLHEQDLHQHSIVQ